MESKVQLFEGVTASDLRGHSLVTCSVSVGNVGQLAVDLLINNLKTCKKIGRVYHAGLEPVIGNEVDSEGRQSLLTTCQLFRDEEKSLVILQFHAPVYESAWKEFSKFLAAWVQSVQFKEVLCLSTTFASERVDAQILDRAYRYIATSHVPEDTKQTLERFKVKQLEERFFPTSATRQEVRARASDNEDGYLPGSGITQDWIDMCEEASIPCCVLLMFVSEGDNSYDARNMFFAVDQMFRWTDVSEVDLKIPQSWCCMYGNDFPQEIY